MKRRFCDHCGEDITYRPKHHYICYDCWKRENLTHTFHLDECEKPRQIKRYNDTYEERYKGDSDYDMGPDWDYDEFPPENL